MKKDDKEKLDTIAELLQQLKLSNAQENQAIDTAQHIVNELRNKDNTHQITKQQKGKVKRGERPNIGDKVSIVNPKGTQPVEGTVIGYTKSGYIKVKGRDGQIVRRIALNLIIQK
jgi:hypothetical protein